MFRTFVLGDLNLFRILIFRFSISAVVSRSTGAGYFALRVISSTCSNRWPLVATPLPEWMLG